MITMASETVTVHYCKQRDLAIFAVEVPTQNIL